MTLVTAPYDAHDGVPFLQLIRDLSTATAQTLFQTPLGVPNVTGIRHGQPIEDCCNMIVVWIMPFTPTLRGDFPVQASQPDRCKHLEMLPTVKITHRRPCAPTPDGFGRVAPGTEDAIAEHLIIDSRALQCGVQATWPPILEAAYPGSRMLPGAMLPTPDSTECMGWDWEVALDLEGCRC